MLLRACARESPTASAQAVGTASLASILAVLWEPDAEESQGQSTAWVQEWHGSCSPHPHLSGSEQLGEWSHGDL